MAADIQEKWKSEHKRIQPVLQQIATKAKLSGQGLFERILSVNQLDAQILDKELFEILRSQFMSIFTFFKEDFIDSYKPELEGALQFAVFLISVWAQGRTYGQQLQNLQYKPMSTLVKTNYLLLTIGVPYILKRLPDIYGLILDRSARARASLPAPNEFLRSVHKLEKLYNLLSTLNFLLFLFSGKYVSLAHRLLGLEQTYLRQQMARRVSFEYMNRQLIWNGFTEFMLFIVPLVPVPRIRKAFNSMYYQAARTLGYGDTADSSNGFVAALNVCPICLQPATMPFVASCGDVYCYYCLKTAMMSDNAPSCAKCSKTIDSMQRYYQDSAAVSSAGGGLSSPLEFKPINAPK